jgi:hypothetical protein
LADRIAHAKPLPEGMPYEHWADWALLNVDRTQVELGVEKQMAITEQFTPCEYFDKVKPVWFRTVLDVVKIRTQDAIARVIDWKTGKMPSNPAKEREAEQQLWLSATAIFVHYPAIRMVRTNLVYLQEAHPDHLQHNDIERKDLPALWHQIVPTLQGMKEALVRQEYQPNPSGLCKKHCAVSSCPHYGVGRG